ncbi:glycosyltransferase [Chryseobacterium sp. P1-3]|uniref:glycosyltransferase n=1 Tax=Chryseobacterium sp. (strain P1-3) TaxID=1517683 RepID=UPI000AF08BC9|nr:glycosyltransferase [Chryseobacterium sp. P1-3]
MHNLQVEVFIVGKLEKEYEDLLHSNKIRYKNYFNISDEELKILYQKADVLLFASIYEGFGLPILEAQAQNTLVVTSNILPMNDVAGEGAILVDPNSIDDIKKGLNIALTLSNEEKNRNDQERQREPKTI